MIFIQCYCLVSNILLNFFKFLCEFLQFWLYCKGQLGLYLWNTGLKTGSDSSHPSPQNTWRFFAKLVSPRKRSIYLKDPLRHLV